MYYSYSSVVLAKKEETNQPNLPYNYADKMFQLQAALQFEGTIQIIKQLNDHYRIGIDYFLERDSRKATHLQKRMTALLANPDNIRILERQTKKNTKNEIESSVEIKSQQSPRLQTQSPALNTRKLKQQVTKFHTVADTCIQNIVQNSNKMADKIQKLKRRDLNKQEEQLNDRIMLKRVKSQQKMNKIKSQTSLPQFTSIPIPPKVTQNVEPSLLKKFIQ